MRGGMTGGEERCKTWLLFALDKSRKGATPELQCNGDGRRWSSQSDHLCYENVNLLALSPYLLQVALLRCKTTLNVDVLMARRPTAVSWRFWESRKTWVYTDLQLSR